MNTIFKCLKKEKVLNLKTNSVKCSGIMYVVRLMNIEEGKSDIFKYLLGTSKPCLNCQTYMHRHSVKKIKYTDIIDGVNVLCEMKRI